MGLGKKENLHIYRAPKVALTFEHVQISGLSRMGMEFANYANGKVDWDNKTIIHCDLSMLLQLNAVMQNGRGSVKFEYCGAEKNKLLKFGWDNKALYIGLFQWENDKTVNKHVLKIEQDTSKVELVLIKNFILAALTHAYNAMMLMQLSPVDILSLLQQDGTNLLSPD